MATPTIQAISAMRFDKSASASGKTVGYEGANAFQGFLQKSTQPEKTVQPKSATVGEKNVTPETERPTEEKKVEPKTDASKELKPENKETEQSKTDAKAELSAEESKKLKEFVEKVQTTLNISAEEMQAWMIAMGMQTADLLDAGKLQNFFMQVKGIDVSDLLTGADQVAQLKELLTTAGELTAMMETDGGKVNKAATFLQTLEEMVTPTATNERSESPVTVETTDESADLSKQQPDLTAKTNSQSDSGKEIKSQQELPKEMTAVFDKVVQVEERILVTENGLEKVTTTVSAKDIFQQVVTKFAAENIDGTSKVTVQLNPEHLGKIAFQVVSREGQVTGQFVAESEAVKTALEAQVSQLKLQLANQGIRVEDVKVVIGDTANYFTEDRPREQQQESAKKRSRRSAAEITVGSVQEEPEAEEVTISTGTIDFTA